MKNIKALRERANLTQEQLAIKMEVDRSAVAKWETEKARPNADKLPQLAQILSCSIDELYNEDAHNEKPA